MSPCAPRPRTHLDPHRPFGRDDPDDIRKMLATRDGAMLNGDPPQTLDTILRTLGRLPAHATTRCDLIKRQITFPVALDLIRDDPDIGEFTGGQMAGHGGRHGPGRSERAAAPDRLLTIRRALRARAGEPSAVAVEGFERAGPCGSREDIAGGVAGHQIRISRCPLHQWRIEQRRTDDDGAAHREHPRFASRFGLW